MIRATVLIVWACNGCDATAAFTYTTDPIMRRFTPFAGGRNYGVGAFYTDKPKIDVNGMEPDGWVPFDPFTQATYCPACWAVIDAPEITA